MDKACKTPIEDLLRSIPVSLVIQYETDSGGFKMWHNCPIGRHAQEAVAKIAALEQQVEELNEVISQCAKAANCFVHPNASIEFKRLLPGEIEAVLRKLSPPADQGQKEGNHGEVHICSECGSPDCFGECVMSDMDHNN